jgi:DNA-binding transcriptional MerR regulator
MRSNELTVGDVAQQTGLTIRTLRYYDEIGLLRPSLHTEAGYRVYTATDLGRLQQVLLLRQIGFSLAEVRRCLNDHDYAPKELIRLHIASLRE